MKQFIVFISILLSSACFAQEINFSWGFGLPAGVNEQPQRIVSHPSGDVYILGVFRDTVDFDPGPGEAFLYAPRTSADIQESAFIAQYSSTGAFKQVHKLGSPDGTLCAGSVITDDYTDTRARLSIDDDGNIIISGVLYGEVDFGLNSGKRIIGIPRSPNNFRNSLTLAIAKYSPDFELLNLIFFDQDRTTAHTVNMGNFEIDSKGNYIISGSYWDSVDIDPGPGVYFLKDRDKTIGTPGYRPSGWYLAKLRASGTLLWAAAVDGPKEFDGGYYDIDCDLNDNIYVTGNCFKAGYDLDPGPDIFFSSAKLQNSGDMILMKYSPDGELLWGRDLANTDIIRPFGISFGLYVTALKNGDIVTHGTFAGTMDLDPSADSLVLSTKRSSSAFIARYSRDGDLIWGNMIDGYLGENLGSLLVDPSDNIYMLGKAEGTLRLALGYDDVIANGDPYTYIIKYNDTGVPQWGEVIAGANTTASSFDALGNLYLGGYTYDAPSVDLDPGPATANIRSGDGSVSMFVAKYTSVFSDVLIPPTLEATVLAFPNPSIDKIQLSITTTTQSILECEIFDALGRSLIASSHLNCAEGENQFVFEELAHTEGTYFLRISDSAGRVKTVKIVRK